MKTLFDTFSQEYISAKSLSSLAKTLNIEPSKLSRLFSKFYLSVEDRYVLYEKNCFIIEEIETGKEFYCAKLSSFLRQLGLDYDDNLAKYVYEVKERRQKTFNFRGKTYRLKRPAEKFIRRTEVGPMGRKINPQKQLNNKIANRVRNRLRSALRKKLIKKTSRTFEYLGCSVDFFMGWLEKQFQENMTWENYGEWHIDHIKPCNMFDFTKEEEVFACFHYTNMRPLWAVDNLSRPKDGSDIIE